MDSIVPQNPPLKQCRTCEQFKPATPEFFNKTALYVSPDGLYKQCKECRNAYRKSIYQPKEKNRDVKCCTKCGEVKPATREYFHAMGQRFHSTCKACYHLESQARQEKTKEKIEEGYKRCKACKEIKPATLEYFPQIPANKDGLLGTCSICHKARRRAYYAANKEHKIEYGRKWRLDNPEKVLAKSRRAQAKPETKQRQRIYRQTHPEERRVARLLRAHREHTLPGRYTAQDIRRQFKAQKGRCYWCHHKLKKYHIDHLIPVTREGSSNWPWNIVLACPHCNSSRNDKLPIEWVGGRLF